MREFMLRNFGYIIGKYQSIPVDIFLEPFVKQIKIKENESYFLNVFDLEFITSAATHRKLSPEIALEFFDLMSKLKLNNYDFTRLADHAMEVLLDRFLTKDIFLQYVFYGLFRQLNLLKSVLPNSITLLSINLKET